MSTAIEMAREAFIKRGFWPNEIMWKCWQDAWLEGAAAEREACAKIADDYAMGQERNYSEIIADAIRLRAQP